MKNYIRTPPNLPQAKVVLKGAERLIVADPTAQEASNKLIIRRTVQRAERVQKWVKISCDKMPPPPVVTLTKFALPDWRPDEAADMAREMPAHHR